MFKMVVVLVVAAITVVCVSATPGGLVAAPYVAPVAPVVTAHSSQVIARNYNGLAAPVLAPLVAAPAVVKAAPVVAAPAVVKAAPLVAAPALLKAAPYVAPAHYFAAPATYAAAPAYYF